MTLPWNPHFLCVHLKNLTKHQYHPCRPGETQLLLHWPMNVQEPFSWATLQPEALAAACCSPLHATDQFLGHCILRSVSYNTFP